MSGTTCRKQYSLEEAPEDIKRFIRIARAKSRSNTVDGGTYALYSEADSGRRYVVPAEYDPDEEKFLTEGIITYKPENKEIKVRDIKDTKNCAMEPKKVAREDFDNVKQLLESN